VARGDVDPRTPVQLRGVSVPVASASARADTGELRRDLAEAAFGREGGPAAPSAPVAPRSAAAYALTVLFLINLMNFFDRQILGAVGE
jgi:hypothetical protein